jgi:hypothetical protein
MESEQEDYFKRKENLVIKDFESAFKRYDKLIGKIASIRQWTVFDSPIIHS